MDGDVNIGPDSVDRVGGGADNRAISGGYSTAGTNVDVCTQNRGHDCCGVGFHPVDFRPHGGIYAIDADDIAMVRPTNGKRHRDETTSMRWWYLKIMGEVVHCLGH